MREGEGVLRLWRENTKHEVLVEYRCTINYIRKQYHKTISRERHINLSLSWKLACTSTITI